MIATTYVVQYAQALEVSVIMRREPIVGAMSRWQSHRWVLEDVVLEGEASPDVVEKTASTNI